ncbi:MAG TPA: thioredoxin family protein [Pirellulales bacterium]|nr:thioredoxin family protein [Pirellulales bacterium]
MTALTLSLLLQVSAVSADGHHYAKAYETMVSTGQPLVVLVGAEWCPACQRMKNSVIPQVKREGGLDKVAYCYVNTDADRSLAGKLMQGGSIPQLILYRKTAAGWTRQQLIGAHGPEETQHFIHRAGVEDAPKLTSR